jgi:DNA-binding MarR family transcriptional regulator
MAERQDAVNVAMTTAKRTPAGDALTRLVFDVIGLSTAFSAKGEALARPAGQTLARWVTLNAVADAPATVAEVSRMFGYARQSVQRVADLLVEDGLASYEDNPRHRRAKLLRPTARGHRVLHQINTQQTAWSNALGAEIGQDDLERTSRVLRRIASTL